MMRGAETRRRTQRELPCARSNAVESINLSPASFRLGTPPCSLIFSTTKSERSWYFDATVFAKRGGDPQENKRRSVNMSSPIRSTFSG